MNKNWTRLLAMSLVATAVVFSSCRKDSDDSGSNGSTTSGGSATFTTAETFDITNDGRADSLFVLGTGLTTVTSVTFKTSTGTVEQSAIAFAEADFLKVEIPVTAVSGPVVLNTAGGASDSAWVYIDERVLMIGDFDRGGIRATGSAALATPGVNGIGDFWQTSACCSQSRVAHGIVSSYGGFNQSPAGGNFIVARTNRNGGDNYGFFFGYDLTTLNDGSGSAATWPNLDEFTVGALHGKGIPLDNPLTPWTASTNASNLYLNFYVYRSTTGVSTSYQFLAELGADNGAGEPSGSPAGQYRKPYEAAAIPANAWTWVSVPFNEFLDGYGFGNPMPNSAVENLSYVRFNVNHPTDLTDLIFAIDHIVISEGGPATEPDMGF